MRRERAIPGKEAGETRWYDRGYRRRTVSHESLAGEFIRVASLRGSAPEAQGNRVSRSGSAARGPGPKRASSHSDETRSPAI